MTRIMVGVNDRSQLKNLCKKRRKRERKKEKVKFVRYNILYF